MPLLPLEFRDNLLEIANYLQGDDYHRVIDRNLKSPLTEREKIEIIDACARITSVLNEKGKEEFIEGYQEKIESEKELDHQVREALNKILSISVENISLEESLDRILITIISLPFLNLENKGGVLLTEEGQNILMLKTSYNLSKEIQTMCAQVPFGHCLCGRAAATRQIQFVDCIDEGHENRYEGIKPHGHYVVPILTSDKVLGVIVVYLTEDHKQEIYEHDFLLAVADILSGLIQRERANEELKQANSELENLHNNLDEAVFSVDLIHNKMLHASIAHETVFGHSQAEFFDNPQLWYEIVVPEDKPIVDAGYPVLFSGKNLHHEFRIVHPDGQIRWIEVKMNPTLDTKGKLIRIDGIATNITGRKQAEEELIKAKERAEESDKLKTAFLNNISHEIRTPFNSILGFLSILQNDDLTASKRDEYTNNINQSAGRLMNTINDIVEISKIQIGQIKLTITDINISKLTRELFDRFDADAKSKKLELNIINNLPKNIEIISSDSTKLNVILSNLINNAIKFTKAGSIEIGIGKNADCLLFSIKDTGIGVPESKQQAIFERFMQADVSNTRQFEGAGLGLAISKAYVEMLGGRIWVESDPDGCREGKGSTFYFTIPLTISNAII